MESGQRHGQSAAIGMANEVGVLFSEGVHNIEHQANLSRAGIAGEVSGPLREAEAVEVEGDDTVMLR